jgi:hypothetical protein
MEIDMTRALSTALRAASLAALLAIAGCNSASTLPAAPQAPQRHLYLSRTNTETIEMYDLPLTAASTPAATVSVSQPREIFVDQAGRLFVPQDNLHTSVLVFRTPLTSASTPAFTLTTLNADTEDVAEDGAGNVYVSVPNASVTGCCIDIFPGPVTGNAIASAEITANGVTTNPLAFPYGIATDAAGNLYTASATSIIKYAPAITASSVPATDVAAGFPAYGVALDASRLYVANGTTNGTIDVFSQPFQNGSTRAFGLVVGGGPSGMTFDAAGDLWYVDVSTGVWEIPAPITASSVAVHVLTIDGGLGIAFGP